MPSIASNVRLGARSLIKAPGLSIVAIIALTLGIGLTTTMYSIVYGALMRGLPYENSDRIVSIRRSNPSQGFRRMGVPVSDYADYVAAQHSFDALAAFYSGTVNLSGTERAERFNGAFITASAFDAVRVKPMLGRSFRAGEDAPGAERVIVLGYALWRNRYASDRAIIGKSVRVNGEPSVVIGVMPDGFRFPEGQDLWLPLRMDPLAVGRGQGDWLNVYGRLKAGVSLDDANSDLAALASRIAKEYPKTNEGITARAEEFTRSYIGEEPRKLLYTMLGAVAFVLLIACANVANLLIGRAAHRSKEVGIRTALGASRWSVIAQFLAESALLATVGAALGLIVAYAGVKWFNASLNPQDVPFFIDIRLHPQVLTFTTMVTVATSLLAGLYPALQASRVDLNSVLKDESRGSSSFRVGRASKGLVMFEIALSCGLLVAAGLMIKSVTKLNTVDYGFSTADIFTARVGLNETKYADSTTQVRFFDELAAKVAANPTVIASGLTQYLPGMGSEYEPFAREGVTYAKERDLPRTHFVPASPGYFRVIGAKVLSGRLIEPTDRMASLPVAVANESFVKRFFKGEDPIGRRVRMGGLDTKTPWLTIVGVVPDYHVAGSENVNPEGLYAPIEQHMSRYVSVVARTRGAATALTPFVRDAVASIDADQPIYFVQPLAERIAADTWHYRVFGPLFMVFGFVALFLASIGLYAVMAFSVRRRTREMGVRMALGANAADVVRLIVRQGLIQIAIGMTAGLALAFGVSRLLAIVLFGVNPRDPVVFAGVVIVLTIAGLIACLVPATRATRIDPVVALRAD